jgi:hypothetical protein
VQFALGWSAVTSALAADPALGKYPEPMLESIVFGFQSTYGRQQLFGARGTINIKPEVLGDAAIRLTVSGSYRSRVPSNTALERAVPRIKGNGRVTRLPCQLVETHRYRTTSDE